MKCSAHSKSVLDDSWTTVDTTSLLNTNYIYCTIAHICHIVTVNSTSRVIQSPNWDLAERRSAFGNRQN